MTADDGTNERQVRALIERWAKAVRDEDLEAIMVHHSPDIVMFDVPPPVRLRGATAYRESWEKLFGWSQGSGIFDLSELAVTAGEDVAFCHGLIRCAGTESDGRRVELAVRLTVGLRKIHGQWTVVHEHHSEPGA